MSNINYDASNENWINKDFNSLHHMSTMAQHTVPSAYLLTTLCHDLIALLFPHLALSLVSSTQRSSKVI